jgi:hypothetical protein
MREWAQTRSSLEHLCTALREQYEASTSFYIDLQGYDIAGNEATTVGERVG